MCVSIRRWKRREPSGRAWQASGAEWAGQTRADSRRVVRIEYPVVMTGPEQFIVRPDLAHQACAVRGRSEQEVSQLVRDRPAEQDPVVDAEIVGQALRAIDKNRGQHTGPGL